MRPTVLLFDIDGTLITTGGVGRFALERTFAEVYGREGACSHFRFDGMTDRAIVRGGLRALGVEETPEIIDQVLSKYVAILEDEVHRIPEDRYFLHRGMARALDAASARSGFAVGLGTGNIREGARVKLSRVGVHERFGFGGFGCDSEDRAELIRIGAWRGAERLGVHVDRCRVVIIGDTPKDVAAALAMGGECVGVGTGSFSPAELRACGAKYAFDTLDQAGALEALLDG
jgi:phosphoglycolate phosphatase-like HAD superfamily hydrolase